MCGIGGQYLSSSTDDQRLVTETQRIVDAFATRGPDGSGVWADAERGVALGHRRLAIIDTTPTGAQPMASASGRWTLTYNGEIYNHDALRRTLADKSVRFRGTSDTEVLVEAFDVWGIDETLRRADGMFAFAVWDHNACTLTLARDRFGEKPLFWCNDGRRFGFASEVRGLETLDGFDRSIDHASIASVLTLGFIANPQSIYAAVRQLRPGHVLEVDRTAGRIVTSERCWWSLRDEIESAVADRERTSRDTRRDHAGTRGNAVAELDHVLSRAVAARMQSDVPLGAFLSGGVDSSLVAALAQRALGSTPLKTFTVTMPDTLVADGTDESEPARRVASHLGTEHTSVELSAGDALAMVPSIGRDWDEPFGDPSMLPSLMLCKAAAQSLKVCLAGDGGDEMFAGYNRHALGQSVANGTDWMPTAMRRGISRALLVPSARSIDGVNRVVSRALPSRWRLANLGDKTRKLAAVMTASPDDPNGAWTALAGVWPPSLVSPSSGIALPDAPAGLSSTERMMWLDTAVVLADDMLVKVDRASMASSLEVRVPFLDPSVLAWSWRQPIHLKTGGAVGKVVVRQLLDTMVPAGIARRPKMGFDPPLATWLRGPLHGWAADLLASPRCVREGWLDGDSLATTWREHHAGSRDWTYRLWSVLMLESWLAGRDP